MIAIANDLLAADKAVPVTALCHVLGLSRTNTYYRPKNEPHERPCDPKHTSMITPSSKIYDLTNTTKTMPYRSLINKMAV